MKFGAAVEEATCFMNFLPLKPKQVEALQSFTSGHDVFVALPTYPLPEIAGLHRLLYALLEVVFPAYFDSFFNRHSHLYHTCTMYRGWGGWAAKKILKTWQACWLICQEGKGQNEKNAR